MEKRAMFNQDVNKLREEIIKVQQTGIITKKINRMLENRKKVRSLSVDAKKKHYHKHDVHFEDTDELDLIRNKSFSDDDEEPLYTNKNKAKNNSRSVGKFYKTTSSFNGREDPQIKF